MCDPLILVLCVILSPAQDKYSASVHCTVLVYTVQYKCTVLMCDPLPYSGPVLRRARLCPVVPGDQPDLGVGAAQHPGHHPHQVCSDLLHVM